MKVLLSAQTNSHMVFCERNCKYVWDSAKTYATWMSGLAVTNNKHHLKYQISLLALHPGYVFQSQLLVKRFSLQLMKIWPTFEQYSSITDSLPLIVHAPRRFTMLAWLPRWMSSFNSVARASNSVELLSSNEK